MTRGPGRVFPFRPATLVSATICYVRAGVQMLNAQALMAAKQDANSQDDQQQRPEVTPIHIEEEEEGHRRDQ